MTGHAVSEFYAGKQNGQVQLIICYTVLGILSTASVQTMWHAFDGSLKNTIVPADDETDP